MVAVATVVASTVLFTVPASQAQEIPYYDLSQAQRQLDIAMDTADAVSAALAATRNELRENNVERTLITGSAADRAQALEESRRRSRQLAVEAYMGGGSIGTSLFLFDTRAASDLTFRSNLVREHAQTALDANAQYADLISSSDETIINLTEGIDAIWRRIEGLESDLIAAQRGVEDAEWVVYIAEIHAIADEEFAERPWRREPTPTDWAELRHCESTTTYDINTGNGFYGAYQFDYQTWFTVGGEDGDRADLRPPEEQDARARLLYSRRGSQPWPECGPRWLDD